MNLLAMRGPWDRAHKLVFSFLVAWLAVWHEHLTPRPIWGATSAWVRNYWSRISPEPVIVLEQVVWSAVLGSVLFLVVHLYAMFRPRRRSFVGALTGVASICGFSFFALLFPMSFFYPFRVESWTFWLALEIAALLICGTLYWIGKWPCSTGPTVGLLVLHFGLWAWVTGTWSNPIREGQSSTMKVAGILISTLFFFGCPVLSFLSTVTWGLSLQSPARSSIQRDLTSRP